MSDNIVGIVGATLTAGERLSGSMGVGRFVVNDYVITLAEAPEGDAPDRKQIRTRIISGS